MLNQSIVVLLLVLPVLSCGGQDAKAVTAAAAPVQLESAERELRCGCKIGSVGHCGNYVAEGDDWLEISNPDAFGLHKMEWCGVNPSVHIKGAVAGVRTGDKIELTELLVDR